MFAAYGAGNGNAAVQPVSPAYAASMLQRDAELLPLYLAVETAANDEASQEASAALQQALDARTAVDSAIRAAVAQLIQQQPLLEQLQVWSDCVGADQETKPTSMRQLSLPSCPGLLWVP